MVKPVSPVRLAAILALLAMFGPFSIDAFFPAFHAVADELKATPLLMQQTISLYLVAYAVMSLFHGALSDVYGRRRVILWGVFAFVVSSIGCAAAQTIEQLLLFRVAQGISTGAGLIVGRAMVRDLYQGAQAQKVMSLISLFFGIAPAIAPVIGGLVFQMSNWQTVFLCLAFYGVALWALCYRVLPETHPVQLRTRFAVKPMLRIYQTIVLDGRFALLVLATGFNFGASFLYISSAPAFIETLLGLGTLAYPWFFLPMIVGMMLGAALSNRLAGVVGLRKQVQMGYVVMALATLMSLAYNFSTDHAQVPWAVLPQALNAVGIALTFPVLTIKMLDRYPEHRGAASSMQAFLWGVLSSVIAAIVSPWLSVSHQALSLGAAVMVLLGFLSWLAYVALAPKFAKESNNSALEREA